MMQKVEMNYDGAVKPSGKTKIKHRQPLESNDKTPKGQIDFIEGWNEMRKCLIDNGLMETK